MAIPISDIENGESGASVRAKLNDVIAQTNTMPLKVWRGLLTQTGTDDPVAVVLVNTLGGDIVWARQADGVYLGTLAGAYPLAKTIITPLSSADPITTGFAVQTARQTDDVIRIRTATFAAPHTLTDGVLSSYPLEIAVYP